MVDFFTGVCFCKSKRCPVVYLICTASLSCGAVYRMSIIVE